MGLATFELPDLGPESNNDRQDDKHRDTESSATEAQFVKGFDTALIRLGNSVRLNFCMAVALSDASGQYERSIQFPWPIH
jgi:hypothetical protein